MSDAEPIILDYVPEHERAWAEYLLYDVLRVTALLLLPLVLATLMFLLLAPLILVGWGLARLESVSPKADSRPRAIQRDCSGELYRRRRCA
jgi:hypothetical protein